MRHLYLPTVCTVIWKVFFLQNITTLTTTRTRRTTTRTKTTTFKLIDLDARGENEKSKIEKK